ncbi:hypothetical protein MRX96_005926 [Rhipicephalus microplus]
MTTTASSSAFTVTWDCHTGRVARIDNTERHARLERRRNYILTSTWVWCFLIVLTGIISFTTTLLIITLVDSEYGDSTAVRGGPQDVFLEAFPPSPPQPVITPAPRNDTHYEDIIF